MLIDELRSLMHANPFRPFFVHLGDSTHVEIHHHDYAWLLPNGGMFYAVDQTGKVHFIATPQITQVTQDAPAASETPKLS